MLRCKTVGVVASTFSVRVIDWLEEYYYAIDYLYKQFLDEGFILVRTLNYVPL